jgi:hypothetical protein
MRLVRVQFEMSTAARVSKQGPAGFERLGLIRLLDKDVASDDYGTVLSVQLSQRWSRFGAMLFADPTSSCGNFSCVADAASKIAATVGAVAGGLWAVFVYRQARKTEAKTAALAAKQPFLSKRLELYSEATGYAAVIAVSNDRGQVAAAKEKFWNLYWGPMAVIEDKTVERAMIAFGEAVDSSYPPEKLKAYAVELAHSCRDSLAESWHVSDAKFHPTGV